MKTDEHACTSTEHENRGRKEGDGRLTSPPMINRVLQSQKEGGERRGGGVAGRREVGGDDSCGAQEMEEIRRKGWPAANILGWWWRGETERGKQQQTDSPGFLLCYFPFLS